MISGVDDEIALICKAPKDMCLVADTLIFFMGDNSQYLGGRQLAGKWLM